MWTRRELAGLLPLGLMSAQQRARRRRGDCFFGIHFDLHPRANDSELGKDLSEANLSEFLDRVRPDFVQYDSKGHNGWLAWPSQVSKSSPGIVQDALPIWRKLTAARGIPLYLHFSGVWDSLAVEEHPEWARVDAERQRDTRQTSLWSAYATERMIPQMLEAVAKYQVDGFWVDGECWATNADYHPAALAAWRQLGLGADAPKRAGEANWTVWLEFQRERFRGYLRTYVAKVKEKAPELEICSNWLYSTYVPEKPELPVDFLSGDYLGNAALSRARLEARYLAQASRTSGKPWDLMAWGFQQANTNAVGHVHKPAEQLKQESGVVLAQGGGFQIYYQPTRAGRIDERHIAVMEEVAAYCRARQALSHKTVSASEAAVLFSKTSLYQKGGKLFGGWGASMAPAVGLLDALLANHLSIDIYPDWATNAWKKVAVPDWEDIGRSVAQALVEQVKEGLLLLVAGAANARLFAPLVGYQLQGEPQETSAWIGTEKLFANARGLWQKVVPGAGTVLASYFENYDSKRPGTPAALSYNLGKGKVVMVPGPIGAIYDATHASAVKEFVGTCWRALGEPQVKLGDQRLPIEVALRKQGEKTLLHFLNYANQQVAGNHATVDFVPPLPATEVELRLDFGPRKVIWQPDGQALSYEYKAGVLRFTMPSLAIHNIVEIA